MKSNGISDSEERIKKATEVLQKFWWFSWFLIIAPLIISVVSLFIFTLFSAGVYIALSFSVIIFMFALLFFYKAFDKYRNNPFFLNKTNNLNARIHVLFLISILSFIVTPIFIFISPPGYSFALLPLISYAVLYNIVYYYYHFQPIDFYNITEGEFKHAITTKLMIKQPYNLIIVVNFIVNIIFLAFTFFTHLAWLYALITTIIFYFITLASTRNTISRIKESMNEKIQFLEKLTKFKQKFVESINSLIFILLIQMPILIIITVSLLGVRYSFLELLNGFFLTLIFILFFFKTRFYISFHYSSKLNLYEDFEVIENPKESTHLSTTKYQKYNSYLSSILIVLITVFSFLIGYPVLILSILPFLYVLFYYEQKAKLCPRKYNRYIYLLNSIAILTSISFGILPQIIDLFLLNIQFIIFFLSLYFLLQIFARYNYFDKENILIYQNILAVAVFSFLIYSLFPIISFEYSNFTSNALIIFISNLLIHIIIISIILLASFYILYVRFFYTKRPKLFWICVLINIFLIEAILYILINLRVFFLVETINFLQILIISSILFPIIFILFIYVNYILGIFPTRNFLIITYYSFWILILTIFMSIFSTNFNNYTIIALDFLLLSVFLHFNLKFGLKLDKLKDSAFRKFVKVNSYFIAFELFFLFYPIFFATFHALLLFDNIFYSIYLSLMIICVIFNIFSKKEIFSETFYIKINVFILLYSSAIAFYYFLLVTISTFYVFVIPLLIWSIIIYIPIFYLKKKKIFLKHIPKSLLINSILLATTISLIPTITGLEVYILGVYFDLIFLIITVINFTLYILLLIFTINYHVLKKVSSDEKRANLYLKLQVLITFCIGITTIFYYSFFLLIDTLYYYIILPPIFTSCFLYIPLFLSYKRTIFNIERIKRAIILNTIILTGLFTSIPVLIGLNLLGLGFVFNFNIFVLNILNSSIYIFYAFLLILSNLSKKFNVKDKFISILNQLKIIILFSVSITTVFLYPFFLLINTLYYIILPSIFTSCFIYILLYYSYKSAIFNIEHIKRAIILNTIILTGLFTSIPLLIGRNLFLLGFVFDFKIFVLNIINSSIYIFYAFLLILSNLSKKLRIKDKFISILNQLKIIILFSISITTIFCYPFFLLINTLYGIFLPIIALLFSWFFLFYYSYKQEYFNLEFAKKLTIYNFIIFSCLIISLPTVIGLELKRIGLRADIILIITITSFLLFSFLKISEGISVKIKLKENFIKHIKLSEIFTWFSFILLISYYIASIFIVKLELTPLTFLILNCCFFVFFILNIYTLKLLSNSLPKLSYLDYFQDIIIYGIILSISFIFTFLNLTTDLFTFLFPGPIIFKISILIGFFFTIFILLLIICDNLIGLKFTQIKIIFELISWLVIKIIICILIFSLIHIFAYQFLIINRILLFSLSFTFLTPLSLFILRKLRYISSKSQLLMKKIALIIFLISILSIYFEIFYILTDIIPFFYENRFNQISIIITNLVLFLYYYILHFNKIIESDSVLKSYRLYITSFILFLSLLFFNSILSILLILLSYSLILSKRSIITISRFLSYFLLSYVTFIEVLAILETYNIIMVFNFNLIGIFIVIYLLTLIPVLISSILLNIKKNNSLEKFSLYSIIPILTFISLNIFTNILVIYNITISLFIILLLVGIHFYSLKDERFKWFIKPCILLFIFDLVSYMSYSWLFNNQIFQVYSPILTFALTTGFTGFGFVLLYNDSPVKFRKTSFLIILASIILSFPIFVYFLIIASLSLPLLSIVPLIFAINFSIFLFYISVGIFQWRISWAIWKSGWYAWMILPLVNFVVIYQSFTGIDVLTNSLRFGIYDVQGSLILSIIICSILYLPVLYTKIKKYLSQILLIIWGESLFLLYWVSQNLFVREILLRNLLFALFAVILLVPLVSRFKYWRINSVLWLIIIGINAFFLFFYLFHIGIPFEIAISIDILVIGLFLIVYSFFPNIRSIGTILITAYLITILGIFLTIYFILLSVILNPIFSVNIALIITGFSLYSSKYVKISKRIIDLFLSWILIFSFSWLAFNTFSLASELLIFAFSLSLTVFGCSFYVFNHYKMKIPINRIIPYLVVLVGSALSITSLSSVLFKITPGVMLSLFTIVIIIFLYFLITEYRHLLLFLIPIPITAPILEFMLKSEIVHAYWFLTWSMLYLLTFQFLFNFFKGFAKPEKETKDILVRIYQNKNQLIIFNFTCFIFNSIFISLFISIIFPILLQQFLFNEIMVIYQICYFLIIWPILFLFCLKYIKKPELYLKLKNTQLFFNKICFFLYLLIPVALGINLFLYMIFININFLISFYLFLLLIFGAIFVESFLLDRKYFYFLFDSTRNKFILWSWFAFGNLLCIFLFLFHGNIFLFTLTISLINLITLYFISDLDISQNKISIGRFRLILIYNSFVWSSFFIASLISNGLIILFEELSGVHYILLLFQNSSLILYFLSYFFVKTEKKLKTWIEFILFILFQGFFAINWIIIFTIFGTLNYFHIFLFLIILFETCLSFKSVKYFNTFLAEQKHPNFLTKSYSFLTIFLYFELSLILYSYSLLILFLGILESFVISLSLLFALMSIDLYLLKIIERSYSALIQTLSYFTISIIIFLSINRFVSQYPFLFSLEIFIFIIMQFYTNYSLFISLSNLFPNKKESLRKAKIYIKQFLGTSFYITLIFLIFQALALNRIELQLLILVLSLIIHGLMILDSFLFRFLGKISNYFKVISWIFIMIFTSINLIWLYIIYFNIFLLSVIPIVIFTLILEFTYLFKLLEFWKFIIFHKEKIRFYLFILFYFNCITWPLYFSSFNLFHVFNLIISSFVIMFIITFFDDNKGILKDNLRKAIRSFSFLTIGGLLSVDIFLLLNLLPDFNFFLNLSIATLFFVIFIGIKIKPFKEHSIIAFIFWAIIFLLLSSILYQISTNLLISGIVFSIMILIYPFVFLLEELRELFSKFVDILIKYFRKFKLLIKTVFMKISSFVRANIKYIWIILSIFISIFFGVLLSPLILNLLHPIHSILIIFPVFGLLFSVMPSEKSDDVDVMFKRRMFRLVISWGSVIGILFGFITPVWYIFTIWISIWILGAVLLPYINFKEKREKISIKWRFYTLIALILTLVILGIIVGIQIYVNFF